MSCGQLMDWLKLYILFLGNHGELVKCQVAREQMSFVSSKMGGEERKEKNLLKYRQVYLISIPEKFIEQFIKKCL